MSFADKVYANRVNLSSSNIKVIEFGQLDLVASRQCIVFVFAVWSAYSVGSFRLLCSALAMDGARDIDVNAINADDLDCDTFEKLFGEVPQGKGEAYWVRNGSVIHGDHGYTDETMGILSARMQEFGIGVVPEIGLTVTEKKITRTAKTPDGSQEAFIVLKITTVPGGEPVIVERIFCWDGYWRGRKTAEGHEGFVSRNDAISISDQLNNLMVSPFDKYVFEACPDLK